MKKAIVFIVVMTLCITVCGAQKRAPAPPTSACGKEVKVALIATARSIGELTASAEEVVWTLQKIEANRNLDNLVSSAESATELKAAGLANHAIGQKTLCRMQLETQGGSDAYGKCLETVNETTQKALDICELTKARVYPHD
jgi:hypothetical protein